MSTRRNGFKRAYICVKAMLFEGSETDCYNTPIFPLFLLFDINDLGKILSDCVDTYFLKLKINIPIPYVADNLYGNILWCVFKVSMREIITMIFYYNNPNFYNAVKVENACIPTVIIILVSKFFRDYFSWVFSFSSRTVDCNFVEAHTQHSY